MQRSIVNPVDSTAIEVAEWTMAINGHVVKLIGIRTRAKGMSVGFGRIGHALNVHENVLIVCVETVSHGVKIRGMYTPLHRLKRVACLSWQTRMKTTIVRCGGVLRQPDVGRIGDVVACFRTTHRGNHFRQRELIGACMRTPIAVSACNHARRGSVEPNTLSERRIDGVKDRCAVRKWVATRSCTRWGSNRIGRGHGDGAWRHSVASRSWNGSFCKRVCGTFHCGDGNSVSRGGHTLNRAANNNER